MIEVPIETAVKSGIPLASNIYGKEGQLLLKAGIVLTNKYTQYLQKLGINSVYIQMGKVQTEPLLKEEVRHRAASILQNIINTNTQSPDLYAVVGDILNDVFAMKGIIQNVINISTYDGYTFSHSIDVCIFAMSIGIQLGYSRSSLMEIGMGALLHDIGKLKIPESIINKPSKLTEDEYEIIKEHPTLGYELIKDHNQLSDRSIRMILEHHERWDGSGYPSQKRGKEIHPFSAVCGIADIYSAMVSTRCYRKGYPPQEIYELILGMGNTKFDFKIVQAFSKAIMPYPKGVLVNTSDGRIAQVAENTSGCPYSPTVIFLDDDTNTKIDLFESGVMIKSMVLDEEVDNLLNGCKKTSE